MPGGITGFGLKKPQAVLEKILVGVPEGERQKITSSNVARLYQLDAD